MIGEISIHFTRYLNSDVDTPHHGGIPANPRLMNVRMHNGPSSSGSTRKRHTKHLSPLTFSHKIFATLTVTKNTNDFLGCQYRQWTSNISSIPELQTRWCRLDDAIVGLLQAAKRVVVNQASKEIWKTAATTSPTATLEHFSKSIWKTNN